eukprot:2469849-Alexandrium_andersonii.AAC.1
MTHPKNPDNHCRQGSPKPLSAELADTNRGHSKKQAQGDGRGEGGLTRPARMAHPALHTAEK